MDNIDNARPLPRGGNIGVGPLPDIVANVDALGDIPLGLFHVGARAVNIANAQPLGGGLDGGLNVHDVARLPDIYQGPKARQYWIPSGETEENAHAWVDAGAEIATTLVRTAGFSGKAQEGEAVSASAMALMHITQHKHVIYAGPLSGYKKGCVQTKCGKMLVTSEAQPIKPVQGEWGELQDFFIDHFGIHLDRFYGWMKVGYERMRDQDNSPMQPFIITGRPGGGKSLLLDLICDVYGGRQADPYKFAMGETQFNIELFQSECLIIDDKAARGDHSARRALGQFLKNCAAVRTQYAHAKGVTGANLKPIWRVMMSCNNNDESINVLPHIDESMRDKLLILDVEKGHDYKGVDARKYNALIRTQLPAFIYFLMNEYTIPLEYIDSRFGVVGFIAPDVEEKLSDMDPESLLWDVMQKVQEETYAGKEISGSCADWAKLLSAEYGWGPVVSKVLVSHHSLGIYLARLEMRFPKRLRKHRTATQRLFTMFPVPAE